MTTRTIEAREVRETVSMTDAICAVREAFIDLAAGRFELPARTVLGDGAFLVMPAHHRPSGSAIVKTLSLDFARVPAIAGTVVWSRTGVSDTVLADAGAVTALRTGAATGVATDLLAAPEASRLTLIGVGGQAADQVRGVHAVRPLSVLTVVSRDPAKAEWLLDELEAELPGVALDACGSAAEAVSAADIVCCATTATEPLFRADELPARVHVNAIGAYRPTMRELPDELLASARVYVDERSAALEESGEIIHALCAGAIRADDLTDLGVALRAPTPVTAGRTVFKSVGLAIQDWAVLRLLSAV